MTEAIYRKKGRRYVEVGWHDPEATYYPHGAHLVISKPGGSLTMYRIDPDHAALLAAAQTMREAMLTAIHKADAMRLKRMDGRPLTKKELAGWEAYKAIAGEPQSLVLEGASLSDVIDAGIAALTNAIKGSKT